MSSRENIATRRPRKPPARSPVRDSLRALASLACFLRRGRIDRIGPFQSHPQPRPPQPTRSRPRRVAPRSRSLGPRTTLSAHPRSARARRQRAPRGRERGSSTARAALPGERQAVYRSWRTERARRARDGVESPRGHYPNRVRISAAATASLPRAFEGIREGIEAEVHRVAESIRTVRRLL